MLEKLKQPTRINAYLFLILTTLFWAGNYTIGRWAAGHVPPITLAFLRWTGAALLILPLAWPALKREWDVIRTHLPILLVLGITGSGLFNTLQYIALTDTTATNAGIINSSAPIMIAGLSFFLNGERLRSLQIAGIAISLSGVLVVISQGDLGHLSDLDINAGDLVMLVAMGVWALYTALLQRRPRLDGFAFAAVTFIIASLLNAGLSAIEIAGGARVDWSPASVAAICYTAVFPSFLAYLCFQSWRGDHRPGACRRLYASCTSVHNAAGGRVSGRASRALSRRQFGIDYFRHLAGGARSAVDDIFAGGPGDLVSEV